MVKNQFASAADKGSIPESGRSPGMATHSSILAWEIPWAGEPGGLQSMGSQRVGNYGATEQQQQHYELLAVYESSHTHIIVYVKHEFHP